MQQFARRLSLARRKASLTIIIALTDSLGHFSTLKAVADELLQRKHRVIFFSINDLDTEGYEAVTGNEIDLILSRPWSQTTRIVKSTSQEPAVSAEDKWTEVVAAVTPVFRLGRKELAKESIAQGHGQCQVEIETYHDKLNQLIKHIKPNVIVSDLMLCYPCIMNDMNVKWVRLFLGASLAIYGREYPTLLPPEWYGLPSLCDSRTIQEYREYDFSIKIEHFNNLNRLLKEKFDKAMPEADKTVEFVPESPYANIYMYPNALDYTNIIKDIYKPKNWHQVDSLVPRDLNSRQSKTFSIQHRNDLARFINQKTDQKKLIYFSMGTLASADLELMKRLLGFLSQDANNLYIISMGPLHSQLELGPNMFGRKIIDQLYVLTKIDLIITHGGNNTITEAFHYGVPGMVVLPVFDDQHDNARRIEEIKVGIRLETYKVTKDILMDSINSVLADDSIKLRMREFAKAAQQTKGLDKTCNMIEEVARK